MRKLYRYNEVPLIEIGLTEHTKDRLILDSIAETINYLGRNKFKDITELELTNLFYNSDTYKKIKDFSSGWCTKYPDELSLLFVAEMTNNREILNLYGNDEYLFKSRGRWFRA